MDVDPLKDPQEESRRLSGARPEEPEDRTVFRLAQLAILLSVASQRGLKVPTVDRLGYLDFFSANPFLVVSGGAKRDAKDALDLKLAGFTENLITYASSGQRFASRRRRLQYDLAILLGYGVVEIGPEGYRLTPEGVELVGRLSSMYAEAYRVSANLIASRLGRMSDAELRRNAERWLGGTHLLIDFLDDVVDPTMSTDLDPMGRDLRG